MTNMFSWWKWQTRMAKNHVLRVEGSSPSENTQRPRSILAVRIGPKEHGPDTGITAPSFAV